MAQNIPVPADPDDMLATAAGLARTLIPNVEARITALKEQLEKAMDQLSRLEQIERIASGVTPTDVPQMVPLVPRKRIRREFLIEDAPTEDDKDAKTTQEDIDHVLEAAVMPMTVAEIKETIEQMLGRKRATSTLYNYLGKGKVAGLYTNDDDGWSLTDKGRDSLRSVLA